MAKPFDPLEGESACRLFADYGAIGAHDEMRGAGSVDPAGYDRIVHAAIERIPAGYRSRFRRRWKRLRTRATDAQSSVAAKRRNYEKTRGQRSNELTSELAPDFGSAAAKVARRLAEGELAGQLKECELAAEVAALEHGMNMTRLGVQAFDAETADGVPRDGARSSAFGGPLCRKRQRARQPRRAPMRRRGSRRAGSTTSRAGPSDDSDPPGLDGSPPARGEQAGNRAAEARTAILRASGPVPRGGGRSMANRGSRRPTERGAG